MQISVFLRWSVILLLNIISIRAVDEQSCHTKCHNDTRTSPACGVWKFGDNVNTASGVYTLGSDHYANLTCSMISLPRPAELAWLFQAEGDNEFHPVKCDSTKLSKHCKFNTLHEHRATVVCLIHIRDLEQNGLYKCTGKLPNHADYSESAHLKVYGIGNFSLSERPATGDGKPGHLTYGKSGEIRVRVCAHPKPHISWIHENCGMTLTTGAVAVATGGYSALPLHHRSERYGQYEPLRTDRYCYEATLLIGKVNSTDRQFTVVASNDVETKKLRLSMKIQGEPKQSATGLTFDKIAVYMLLCVNLIFLAKF